MILDLFAGPGGWDTGLRLAGHTGRLVGIEHDLTACRTAVEAGHPRICADAAAYPPSAFASQQVDGLIASPPCQAWSMAGDRRGLLDQPAVYQRMSAEQYGVPQTRRGERQKDLAAEFGMSEMAISHVARRETWRHVV